MTRHCDVGHDGLRRRLEYDADSLRTTALELGDKNLAVDSVELSLVLDTASWRHDIATWRWHDGEDDAIRARAMDRDLDDSNWRVVPHLHPVLTVGHDRPCWFRTLVSVPASAEGEDVSIVLGGFDDEDWTSYTVFFGAVEIGRWDQETRLRQPRTLVLRPRDAAYAAIDLGGETLLAVRVEGLRRSEPTMRTAEEAHYFFQGWLLDQFVAAGRPTLAVDDFRPVAEPAITPSGLAIELASARCSDVRARIEYDSSGGLLRKHAVIYNDGAAPLRLLDVTLEDWRGDLDATAGGRGLPVLMAGGFAGIEHPAGVQFADGQVIRIVQMPGRDIPAAESWTSQPVVIGAAPGGDAAAAFRAYIRQSRPRPRDRWLVYSPLGWYDFTNPADPLPELTEPLALENLARLGRLVEHGITPDIYMFDDWWDHKTLERFRASAYPSGPGRVVEAVRRLGMRPGLWWATTRALWSAGDAAFLEPSRANGPEHGEPVALAGGEWAWLDEFANLFIGERRYCLSAEPYRSHALASIPGLVEQLGAGLLKLDCAVLHCTSSAHDHRSGRHSVEPIVDAVLAIVDACRAREPEMRVVWYWGFRSPWFLRHGDSQFDKGLLMEAATPASMPSRTTRQAMSLNVDQSIRHAQLLPLELQDSLGVWVGDVAWCNRIGTEEWREAFLLDAARGSWLIQPWGDLDMLGREDHEFLGRVIAWARRIGHAGVATIPVGGDPWAGDVYGYARPADGGTVATLVNPSWKEASIVLPPPLTADRRPVELYPSPSRDPADVRLGAWGAAIVLRPFELRVLAFLPHEAAPLIQGADFDRPTARATRMLTFDSAISTSGSSDMESSMGLPEIGLGDTIMITARLAREQAWWYHPEPHRLVDLRARLDGLAVRAGAIPRWRDRNGPGCPWVLYDIPCGPAWSGRSLDIVVSLQLPDDVRVSWSAAVVHAWWRDVRRGFRDPIDT